MSRIGRLPVAIPAGVTVDVTPDNIVKVKGPKGSLEKVVDKCITVKVEDGHVVLTRSSEEKEIKAKHGLYRALIHNMVIGLTEVYSKSMQIKGVGWKVAKQGNKIVLNVGFSHPVEFAEPEGIKIDVVDVTEIKVSGIDKEAVGQCCANIRTIRKPEPYHGYGIRFKDEYIAMKEGKKGK